MATVLIETIKANQEETEQQAKIVLLRAIVHLQAGWIQGDYAQTADGRPTNPLAAEATAWCVDGACMLAQHETGASREAMRLVQKALTLTCSARKGTKIEPFRWANEVNDLPGITRFYMIAILRHAAEVVPLAHLVQGGTYPPGWAKKILKQAQEG